jgi:two-component system, cell cycle sensor histidine kinase and response regulator CckA
MVKKAKDHTKIAEQIAELKQQIKELEQERIESDSANRVPDLLETDLDQLADESYCKSIFDNTPISIWYEDISAVMQRMQDLRKSGIENFDGYLNENPHELISMIKMVKVVDVNNCSVSKFAAKSKEHLINNISTLFDDSSILVFKKEMLAIWQGKQSFESDAQMLTIDGRKIQVLVRVNVLPSKKQNSKTHIVVTILDISFRMRAEIALRESERKYRQLFDLLPYGGEVLDPEGFIIDCSASTAKMLGYPRSELVGKHISEVFDESSSAIYKEKYPELLQGKSQRVEIKLLHKNGHAINILRAATPVIDSDGRVSCILALNVDISQRIKAENERLDLERQVQHAQKLESLGVLAGGIAHDFNNLLMAILGNTDIAIHDISPLSPARESLLEIEKATKRAAELAKQMLAYSGKGSFIIESIDAGELVSEMMHLLEVSISKRISLKYNFADNLPSFNGDVTQIRQIIMNMITNASEAIGENTGTIALSTGAMICDQNYLNDVDNSFIIAEDDKLSEGLYVYFEVTDSGCGMDSNTFKKIFDPFFSTKFTGRGLGMSAVLGIIRGHKGFIRILTEVDKGSTFKVFLPANEFEIGDNRVSNDESRQDVDWSGSGTILIVDDEESIRAVGSRMLEKMGFNVLTAADGADGLRIFNEYSQEIVCVLLDLTMPFMDGEEAFREMRRISPEVNVVLCSGYNELSATKRFKGKGLAGFINKPFTMALLKEKLMDILDSSANENCITGS